MIDFRPIASSSAGNCYWLDNGRTPLLLECGIPIRKIMAGINYRLSDVAGCLVTHGHKDHSKSINDLTNWGVKCYMSEGTLDTRCPPCDLGNIRIVKPMEQFEVGDWTVMPFETEHDCAGSLGYMLRSGDEVVMFALDTAYLRPRFSGMTMICVECNYDAESLDASWSQGRISGAQRDRIIKTHFGLDNVVEFLAANDLSQVREVHLLHLSSANSNERMMVDTIKKRFGIPTYAAPK